MTLRLGVLGMSEGNGHPYSWSAIFNGYDPAAMASCPFPVIPQYLARQAFPDDAIPDARVTHVWTQERAVSEHIAAAARIGHVVDRFEEMIGAVDAILLARDDPENHFAMAAPFLAAGLPVYIDKPLAPTVAEGERIYRAAHHDGQIFSCSAFAHAPELDEAINGLDQIGDVLHVDAVIIKDWRKYGIHVVEPLMRLMSGHGRVVAVEPLGGANPAIVRMQWASGVQAVVVATGTTRAPIGLRVFGRDGYREVRFQDTFNAFKNALKAFVGIVRKERAPQDPAAVLEVIRVIEEGGRHG